MTIAFKPLKFTSPSILNVENVLQVWHETNTVFSYILVISDHTEKMGNSDTEINDLEIACWSCIALFILELLGTVWPERSFGPDQF